ALAAIVITTAFSTEAQAGTQQLCNAYESEPDRLHYFEGLCGKSAEPIEGTAEDDKIKASGWGNHKIRGHAGNDTIDGGRGNDEIWGGSGNDIIDGGQDNDKIWGEKGNDTIDGSWGDDRVWGGPGNDTIWGSWGQDRIRGERGDDFLYGGEGNDYLYGELDNDRLYGGPGDDWLIGHIGADYLQGGPGSDVMIGGCNAAKYSDCNGRDYKDTFDLKGNRDGDRDIIVAHRNDDIRSQFDNVSDIGIAEVSTPSLTINGQVFTLNMSSFDTSAHRVNGADIIYFRGTK
ncbi:MAG: calcium-binding protein, partial [Alphaproteobacteria bacterium]|nr:calcium-binding protein [Alphaproteobacteria bacterium]